MGGAVINAFWRLARVRGSPDPWNWFEIIGVNLAIAGFGAAMEARGRFDGAIMAAQDIFGECARAAVCPEHGAGCVGDACCCADLHEAKQ
jgi:hypothetical protein